MLKKVNLKNTIVIWDSFNTRLGTESAVVDADADIVEGLKFNQSLLEDDVITTFEFVDKDGYRHEALTDNRVSKTMKELRVKR